jgi:arylformamidase
MTTKPVQKIYDISPIISKDIAVFPGDTPFQRDILMSFEKKNHLLLSTIKSTVHLGAHADAPNHYDPSGCGIGERDLHFYIGPCQVISVNLPPKARIKRDDLKNINIKAPRVLFKTGSFDNPDQWNDNFNSLSPEIIDWLAEKQVILVGIDTPSVDPADSKELDSHHTIFKNNFAILEGLLLKNISDGLYELIALPLKIKDADASPVRAILIENRG